MNCFVLHGGTQPFQAMITGAIDASVKWTASGGGTISAEGLYTAPTVVSSAAIVTVTATSVADPTKSSTVLVKIPTPPAVTPDQTAVSLQQGANP